ncbi:hypothetical protein OXX69_009207 [Metschnikowia pulcherrima]
MSTLPLKAKFTENGIDEDAMGGQAVLETYSAVLDDDNSLDEDASWLRDQRVSHKALHWLRRPSVAMVGFVIFLFAFATGTAEGTRQLIVLKLACNSLRAESGLKACDPASTQVLVSGLQQAYSVARGIAIIVASGKVGPLSDKHGRKVFLIGIVMFSIIGNFARYALTTTYPTLQFRAMVATEFLANFSGGGLTVLTLANCYVSDIADASQRTYFMGLNIASLFIGMSTGPLVGNFVITYAKGGQMGAASEPQAKYGPDMTQADFAPLRFEIVVLLFLLVFVVFILPESRGETARRMSRSLSQTPSMASLRPEEMKKEGKIWQSLNFLRPIRLIFYPKDSVHRSRHRGIIRTRIAVILLVMTDCFISSLGAALGEVYVLFGVFKYNFNAVDIGHLMAVTCASRAVALVIVSPVLTFNVFQNVLGFVPNKRRFDGIDYGVVTFAFVFEILGQLCLSRASNGLVFLACLVLNAFSCLAMPALHSSIVKFYPESKLGEVFGGMAIVKNVFMVASPVAVLALYKTAVANWESAHALFLIFAGVFAVLILLMTFVIVTLRGVDAEALEAEEQLL